MPIKTPIKPPAKPTCKGCEHYERTWCKRYGSIINFDNPITSCYKRK